MILGSRRFFGRFPYMYWVRSSACIVLQESFNLVVQYIWHLLLLSCWGGTTNLSIWLRERPFSVLQFQSVQNAVWETSIAFLTGRNWYLHRFRREEVQDCVVYRVRILCNVLHIIDTHADRHYKYRTLPVTVSITQHHCNGKSPAIMWQCKDSFERECFYSKTQGSPPWRSLSDIDTSFKYSHRLLFIVGNIHSLKPLPRPQIWERKEHQQWNNVLVHSGVFSIIAIQ